MITPLFSVIIPIRDQDAHLAPFTLDSILSQDFGPYEAIVIDGRSRERPPINPSDKVKIFKTSANLSAMCNAGVEQAKGKYLQFLLPGEFYISRNTFKFLKEFIEQNGFPDLAYTGTIVRHSQTPAQQLFRQIEKEDLKGGKIPEGLRAYWFKKEVVVTLGKFNPSYQIQGGFDLICRFYRNPTLSKAFLRRILVDYEYRLRKPKWILRQHFEALRIIFLNFGFSKAVLFWLALNHLRLFRWWTKNVQGAFWKQ